MNGGWRRYWAIDERGEKIEISKAHFRAIFETDIVKLRDEKIKGIINE